MAEQTAVTISLEEYKDFVIYEHEQGKLKKGLTQEINELKTELEHLQVRKDNLLEEMMLRRETYLDLAFIRSRMDSDGRSYQTNPRSIYFGFDSDSRKKLEELGFTEKELVDYINKQWDEKEKAEKTDEEDDL